MEALSFIDDYLVRIRAGGEEYRAFYEFNPGEADNRILVLTFKSGEILNIQTAGDYEDGRLLFHYLLPEGFFSSDDQEPETGPETDMADLEDPVPRRQ